MGYCIVSGCSNHSSNKRKNWEQLEKENSNDKFSFHLFPKDTGMCNKWLEALNLRNWYPCKTAAVCSAHFRKEDYEPNLALKRLKKNAIPYLSVNETLRNTESIRQHKSSIAEKLENINVGTSDNEIFRSMDRRNSRAQNVKLQNPNMTQQSNISPKRRCNSSSSARLQDTYMKEMELSKRKLCDTAHSEKKAKKEIYRLRVTITELKKPDLIPINKFDFLQVLNDSIKELIKSELRKHKCLPLYLKIN